ncbi:MAG: winged helix-turn-helix domain-containing protein [Clostridia bacterium]|nr:winged helix-turn-helix domain-containing protein [Clostridia bacterium]
MAQHIRIQMMDHFMIYIDERKMDQLSNKSKKGAALIQFLLLHNGTPVPNHRLLSTLWDEDKSMNPENALKTLISRLRVLLNQIAPDLGNCIVADRGAYHWECMPNMTVDMYELDKAFDRLAENNIPDDEQRRLYEQVLELYRGDLLQHADQNDWALTKATTLHNKYMAAIYSYVDMLKNNDQHNEIVTVCRRALEVDSFDDRLHMELMTALIRINRTGEALVQYKHVVQLNYRYLGVQPSEDLQEFYKQIVNAGKTLDFNLDSIRNELQESGERHGAFVCEYAVFKEIYNLQMRNLERLGATMFLGIIMVSPYNESEMDTLRQDNIMNNLLQILSRNLRKGDTVTRFAPNIFALLLPTVNYNTGSLVMERIKRIFYTQYPNSNIVFNYRIGPLSSEPEPHA